MAHWLEETENMVYAGRIKVPYRWYVGEVGSRFLTALRDKKEIWGTRCSRCNRVYVPPAKNCGECFSLTDEWVQVENTGTLQSFTVVRYSHDMQPRSVPFAYGLIKLDGAEGSLLHFIGDTDLDALQVGMRVEAVFAEEREGSILDIQHFRPVAGGD